MILLNSIAYNIRKKVPFNGILTTEHIEYKKGKVCLIKIYEVFIIFH